MAEYPFTVRLDYCHHHIELFLQFQVSHEISVSFYLIGEEMSLSPTIKPWMCNVFEVKPETEENHSKETSPEREHNKTKSTRHQSKLHCMNYH